LTRCVFCDVPGRLSSGITRRRIAAYFFCCWPSCCHCCAAVDAQALVFDRFSKHVQQSTAPETQSCDCLTATLMSTLKGLFIQHLQAAIPEYAPLLLQIRCRMCWLSTMILSCSCLRVTAFKLLPGTCRSLSTLSITGRKWWSRAMPGLQAAQEL